MPGLISEPNWTLELNDYVSAMAVDPSSQLVAAGSLAGDGVVADAMTGDVLAKLTEHPLGIATLAWTRSGERLAAGGQDGVVRIVDRDRGEIAAIATDAWVHRIVWSPDGRFAAIGSGKHVMVANADGMLIHRYPPLASTVTDLAWVPNSGRVGAVAYGGITWFEVSNPAVEPAAVFEWKGSLLGLAIAPNGRWACAGSQDASVHLWKLWSGDELSMSGYPAKVERLVFSPEGQWLAVGCLDGLTTWDFSGKGPSGRAPASGDAHERHIEAIAWQRDGGRLVTGCAAGRLALWRRPRKAREELQPLDLDDGQAGVSQLAWHRVDALFVGRADGLVEQRAVAG